ncbi:MAG: hypothetical protein LBK99_13325, partial [Opitutaceae bacterium]|nr:hypothetical protein [Opitutaceae bacterium]
AVFPVRTSREVLRAPNRNAGRQPGSVACPPTSGLILSAGNLACIGLAETRPGEAVDACFIKNSPGLRP